jgi:hypothetical protein
MDLEVEAQLIHEGISIDQSGPPVLEPTMVSCEILPEIDSPQRVESGENLEIENVPISESFVTERLGSSDHDHLNILMSKLLSIYRIMSALGVDESEVCFQDIISETCSSRRQVRGTYSLC